MTIEEVKGIIDKYKWLCEVKDTYLKHIELIRSNGDGYIVRGIQYSTRGQAATFGVYSQVRLNSEYIVKALEDALMRLDKEIEGMTKELKQIGIDV